jgi:hypothetical protein
MWQSWVDAHNIRRCMHDVPPLSWSNAMYANVKKVFQNQRQMSHSDCYGVPAPAGPAGENLAWASYSLSPDKATEMWYDEVNDCGPFPGCQSGARGAIGHFTALIWNGVKEIGCHANHHGLRACQYRGGDSKDCTTPNMGGHYGTNVFKPVYSQSECEKRVKQCKSGGGSINPIPEDDDAGEAAHTDQDGGTENGDGDHGGSGGSGSASQAVRDAERAATRAEKAAEKAEEAAEMAMEAAAGGKKKKKEGGKKKKKKL